MPSLFCSAYPLPLRALPSPLPLMLPPTPSLDPPPTSPYSTRPSTSTRAAAATRTTPSPGLRRRGLSHLLSLPLPVIFSSALSSSPAPGCDLLCSTSHSHLLALVTYPNSSEYHLVARRFSRYCYSLSHCVLQRIPLSRSLLFTRRCPGTRSSSSQRFYVFSRSCGLFPATCQARHPRFVTCHETPATLSRSPTPLDALPSTRICRTNCDNFRRDE